jgi:hypothetical protein
MLLPDKYIRESSSTLGQAAFLLSVRRPGMTVSDLWHSTRESDHEMSYDSFILSLDLLYLFGAVELNNGVLEWRSA